MLEWVNVFFFQAEDGIRDIGVTEFRRVLFRSMGAVHQAPAADELHPRQIGEEMAHARTVSREEFSCNTKAYTRPEAAEIGRASCRERVEISVVAVSLKKKNNTPDVI